MALYKVTVKSTHNINGVRIEKEMSADVVTNYDPIGYQNGEATRQAFLRIFGLDLKKAGALSRAYLDVVKRN